MDWPIPNLADVLKARRSISPYLPVTPSIQPTALAAILGCRVVLKCENLSPTGAFKVRGGVNLLASLKPEVRARGVVAASTGNHGQSVAYAARLFGCTATIFMPEAANRLKVQATMALGSKVIETGRDFDAARVAAEEHATSHGLRYIHSANEPLLVAGVGTATLELLEAVPELDVIFVPVGGGSGVLGAGTVARAVNPAIKIIGVQAEGRRLCIAHGAKGAGSSPRPSIRLPKGSQLASPSQCPWPCFPTRSMKSCWSLTIRLPWPFAYSSRQPTRLLKVRAPLHLRLHCNAAMTLLVRMSA